MVEKTPITDAPLDIKFSAVVLNIHGLVGKEHEVESYCEIDTFLCLQKTFFHTPHAYSHLPLVDSVNTTNRCTRDGSLGGLAVLSYYKPTFTVLPHRNAHAHAFAHRSCIFIHFYTPPSLRDITELFTLTRDVIADHPDALTFLMGDINFKARKN